MINGVDKDLLPWIVGGALIAAGMIAAAIQFTAPSSGALIAPRNPPVVSAAAGSVSAHSLSNGPVRDANAGQPAMAVGAQPAIAAPADLLAARATIAVHAPPPNVSAADSPELPPGQVWECTEHGQKVFSDSRCGNGASVRQLGELNMMEATMASPPNPYPIYRPGYGGAAYPSAPPLAPQMAPPPQDDEADSGAVADYFYPGQQFIPARDRPRREHLPHHEHQLQQAGPNRGALGPGTLR